MNFFFSFKDFFKLLKKMKILMKKFFEFKNFLFDFFYKKNLKYLKDINDDFFFLSGIFLSNRLNSVKIDG